MDASEFLKDLGLLFLLLVAWCWLLPALENWLDGQPDSLKRVNPRNKRDGAAKEK